MAHRVVDRPNVRRQAGGPGATRTPQDREPALACTLLSATTIGFPLMVHLGCFRISRADAAQLVQSLSKQLKQQFQAFHVLDNALDVKTELVSAGREACSPASLGVFHR